MTEARTLTPEQRLELYALTMGLSRGLKLWQPDSADGWTRRAGGLIACNAVAFCFHCPVEIDWPAVADVAQMGLDVLGKPNPWALSLGLPERGQVQALLTIAQSQVT